MRSGLSHTALLSALLASGVGGRMQLPSPVPPRFQKHSSPFGYRRRDTKARFDRAHTNRRRKLALASKQRNRR
jgi:hypothetical protein